MNWMAFLAGIFGVAAVLAAYVALIFRDRVHLLESLGREQRQYIDNLRRMMDEYVEAADLMNDCNVELERRNVWLEQRRHVILRRWWRRAEQTHRRLARWQVRKGYGQ